MVNLARRFAWILPLLNMTVSTFAQPDVSLSSNPAEAGETLGTRISRNRLPLWLGNQAGTQQDVVSGGRQYMEDIFDKIGVQIVWQDDPRALARPLIALIVPAGRATALRVDDRAALGVTFHNQKPGGLVYVFYDRVERAAAQHRVETSLVMGAVLAHEVAHAVLCRDAHTQSGLMRASWDELQFRLMRGGLLQFSSSDGEAIRSILEIHSLE